MLLFGSRLRPPSELGPGPLVRLACDAGVAGLAVDGGCFLSDLPAVAAEGLKAGVPVEACFGPVAVEPLQKSKRLPFLVALDDKEERQQAIRLAQKNLEVARSLGATRFILDMGVLSLRVDEADLRERFARVEMGERDAGDRLRGRALSERRALEQRILDVCRATLEPLARVAEHVGSTLILLPAPSPWHVPSPRELDILLRELSGAPVAPGVAPAWRAALATLHLGGPEDRWNALTTAAKLTYATDGVGLVRDLAPGLGEVWIDDPPALPDAPVLISGRADTSAEETLAARDLIQPLVRGQAAPPVAS